MKIRVSTIYLEIDMDNALDVLVDLPDEHWTVEYESGSEDVGMISVSCDELLSPHEVSRVMQILEKYEYHKMDALIGQSAESAVSKTVQ